MVCLNLLSQVSLSAMNLQAFPPRLVALEQSPQAGSSNAYQLKLNSGYV